MLEVGKLYICKEYYLMLYPDPLTAAAAHWSKRFGKPVLFSEKNIPLLILNNKEKYIEVLAGEKKGWIIYPDWLKIKEIE